MKRVLVLGSLVIAATVVACDDDGVAPSTTGTISLRIVSDQPAPSAATQRAAPGVARRPGARPERPGLDVESARASDAAERLDDADYPQRDRRAAPVLDDPPAAREVQAATRSDTGLSIPPPNFDVAGHLDAARASVFGPTNKTVNLTSTGTSFTGTIDGLVPGSYIVVVEGLVSGEVDFFGQTSGVQVQAGQNTTASISFNSFQPDLSGVTTPTTALRFRASWPDVSNAAGYELEWDTDPAFSNPTFGGSLTVPNVDIQIPDLGTYYLQARASNQYVAAGRWSDPQAVVVTTDISPTGSDPATAAALGFGETADGSYADYNIHPLGDSDWFSIDACGGDVLTVETFAERLDPFSNLDTYVQIFDVTGTTLIAENDGFGGADSRVATTLSAQGTYLIRISASADNSVGHYEFSVDVTPGPANTGVDCSGGIPTSLVFRSIPSPDARATFTVDVEIQDDFGNVVSSATDNVTLDFGANPGAMIFHASGFSSRVLELVDPVTPALLPALPGNQIQEITALTYDASTGVILASDLNGDFSSMDPVTGQQTILGSAVAPASALKGLAFEAGTGQLLGVDVVSDELYQINPSTGAATSLGIVTGVTIVGFNGLATDPTTGTLYAVSRAQQGPPPGVRELITVNPTTLVATTVGTLSENGVAGIAFLSDGTLLAVTGDGAPLPERLWAVDKATGGMTIRAGLGSGDDGEAIAMISARLSGTLTVAAVNGVATFSDLQIDAPAVGYTLVATASGLTDGTSAAFDVNALAYTPGLPQQLAFRTVSSTVDARTTFTVDVEVQDALGVLVPTANDNVTLDFSNNAGSMLLRVYQLFPTTLQLVDPVTPQALTATPSSNLTDEMGAVTYDPSTATVLVAERFNLNLNAVDPLTGIGTVIGPLVTPMKGLAFELGPSGRLIGVAQGANEVYEIDPANGAATFLGAASGVTIAGFNGLATDPTTGTMYAVSRPALTPFVPTARELVSLNPTTTPPTAASVGTLSQDGVSGIAFLADGTMLAITGDGATNNEVLWIVDKTTAAMTRLLGLSKGCCGEIITALPANLTGTTTVAAVGGVATFSVQIDAPGSGYTLTATAAGLTDGFSAAFDVNPGVFTPGPAVAVEVSPTGAALLTPGAMQTFSADAYDALGSPVSGVTWSSLNPAIATVDPVSGDATAVATGQVSIGAQVDGQIGYGLLTVATPLEIPWSFWDREESGTVQSLRAVWGPASDDLFAVGDAGEVHRYDGLSWSLMSPLPPTAELLEYVWGTASDEVFVVGASGGVYQWDGSSWNTLRVADGAFTLYHVWGTSPDDVFMVGSLGTILHWDGGSLTSMVSGTGNFLLSVWGTASDDVFVVGDLGTILRFDGTNWNAMTSNTTQPLWSVGGTSSSDVYAGTSNGEIHHYDGNVSESWSFVTQPTTSYLWKMFVASPNEIFVTSGSPGGTGQIVQFNGTSWSAMNTTTNQGYLGVFGTPSGELIATGFGGEIHRSRGLLVVAGVGSNFSDDGTTTSEDILNNFGDVLGVHTGIDAATFNAMTPADLRANYDVLLFTWNSSSTVDADWTTRLLPYLNLGGGIIFEDDVNIADLSAVITSTTTGGAPFTISATVPGLTDGITSDLNHLHMSFSAWDAGVFSQFIGETTGNAAGLKGTVGDSSNGCIVVTGPDPDYHGIRGSVTFEGNEYSLLVNELRWVAGC